MWDDNFDRTNEKIRMAKSTIRDSFILLSLAISESILSLTLQSNQRRNHKNNFRKESSRPSNILFTNIYIEDK